MTTTAPPPVERGPGPLKFLEYFTADDAGRLEGRVDAIERVSVGVIQHRTFVLYGASGAGKTSLLLAGVFPELDRRGYDKLYVRVLTDPVLDLHAALRKRAGETDSARSIKDLVAGLSQHAPLVIAFDQFEEFFIRFESQLDRQEAFRDMIADLLHDPTLEVRVIFSLRQEWLANLGDFREAIPDLFVGEYRLQLLTSFGARRAIASQLDYARVEYEPRLLVRLVDYLERYRFDPTILQLVCAELYRLAALRDAKKVVLLVDDLENLGTVDELFVRYLEVYANAVPDLRLAARAVLDALTTGEGTKFAITADLIRETGCEISPADLAAIITALRLARLVRVETRPAAVSDAGEPPPMIEWYELVHERLVDVIEAWLRTDREYQDFRAARENLTGWMRSDVWQTDPEVFPSGELLRRNVLRFKDYLVLSSAEEEFIVRGTMYGDPVSVGAWCKRIPRTPELVRAALRDANPMVRIRAIRATVPLVVQGFGEDLIGLSLNDPEESVREAAGDTLALVTAPGEREKLVIAYGRDGERARAREALVRLAMTERLPPKLWKTARFSIEREAASRRQDTARKTLEGQFKAGAYRGLSAAIAWTVVVALPLGAFYNWSIGKWVWALGGNVYEFLGVMTIVMLVAVILGIGCGGAQGKTVRRLLARWPNSRPATVSFRAGAKAMIGVALAIGVAVTIMESESWLMFFLVTVLAWTVLKPLTVGLAWLSHALEAGRPRPWPIRFAITASLPVLLCSAVAESMLQTRSYNPFWAFYAQIIGFLAFLVASEWPAGTTGRRWSRPASRVLAILVVGVTWGWLVMIHRPDTLPLRLLAHRTVLGDSVEPFRGKLHHGLPDANFYRITSSENMALFASGTDLDVKARFGRAEESLIAGVDQAGRSDSVYFAVPGGDYWLSLSPRYLSGDGYLDYSVWFDALLNPQPREDGGWSFTTVPLSVSGGGGVGISLAGTFRGQLTDRVNFNAIEFRVLPFNPLPPSEDATLAGSDLLVSLVERDTAALLGRVGARFVPGPAAMSKYQFASGVLPLLVPADTGGRWTIELGFTHSGFDDLNRKIPPLKSESVPLIVGYRPQVINPHVYVEEALKLAQSMLGTSAEYAASRVRSDAASLVTLISRFGMLDSTESAERICEFGALNVYGREVLTMCDVAVRSGRSPGDARVYRAAVRLQMRDFVGAEEDLRTYLRQPPGSRPSEDLLKVREWRDSVLAGRNPFVDAGLLEFRLWIQKSEVISAAVKG